MSSDTDHEQGKKQDMVISSSTTRHDDHQHDYMDSFLKLKSQINPAVLFLFFLGALISLCFWSLNNTNSFTSFLSKSHPLFPLPNITVSAEVVDDLEAALIKASMPNKTVIITIINKAYAIEDVKTDTTMLDVFLDSFWLGEETRPLRDHLLIVAVDPAAYERCLYLRLNCYELKTDDQDFAGEELYMSPGFVKMMWRRTKFVLDVLKRGYSFIFTDTDIMWLRDPLKRLSNDTTEDMQISTDLFNKDPWSEGNLINTGFYFVRSNNKTIALYEKWYNMKDNSTGLKEQDVLIILLRGGIIPQLGLKIRFLDTIYFSGFCTDSTDFRVVTTVHSNCCRSITAKVKDLRVVLRDWKKYNKFAAYKRFENVTANFKWTGHFGCWNSWKTTRG